MRLALVILLGLIGVAAIVLGVVYLTVPAHELPTFIPGHIAGALGKHPKRGYVTGGVGVALFVIAIIIGMVGQPKRHGSLK